MNFLVRNLLLVAMAFGVAGLAVTAAQAKGGGGHISMGHTTMHTGGSSGSTHFHYYHGSGWGWGHRGYGNYYDYENPYAWGTGAGNQQAGFVTSLDAYNREHDAMNSQLPAAAYVHEYSWPQSSPSAPAPVALNAYSAKSPTTMARTCQINGAPSLASSRTR